MERLRRQPDLVLATAILAVAVAELAAGSAPVHVASYALVPFATVPLVMRRRVPLAALSAVLATNVVHVVLFGTPLPALGDPPNSFALALGFLCAVYSAAAYATPRQSVVALFLAFGGVAAFTATAEGPTTLNDFLAALLFSVVVPWLIGVARARQRHVADERSRRAELERRREHEVQAAIELERTRIARELHDIVAHSLGVIVVQAAAERRVLKGTDHEETKNVLATIERSGRSALVELRRLLGLLRSSEAAELVPQPGIADINDVVATVRGAGVDARLHCEGMTRELPPGVALSAYRVVQEALTNVVKHADATTASITIRYEPEALVVEVIDNGVAMAPAETSGFGLIGMAERVSLFGGHIDFGPRPEGPGFRVVARLPATSVSL